MNELTKLKISYKLRNRKKSATHVYHISSALKGKKKSPTHKKAISESMKKYWACKRKITNYRGDKTCKFANLIKI